MPNLFEYNSRMRNKLRKIHIDDQEWLWVVGGSINNQQIRIYSPTKLLYRLKPSDINATVTYEEYGGDKYYSITTGHIKDYIVEHLINNQT